MLQFQSPLVWILHVWLAILWVLLFYLLGLISTWYNILFISIYILPNFYCRFDITDWEHILLTEWHMSWDTDQSERIILNPFNFFEWKAEMDILLRDKFLYKVTMETREYPNLFADKIKWHSRRHEAYGLLSLSISRDLLFHLDALPSPN